MKKITECSCQIYSMDNAKLIGSVASLGVKETLYQNDSGEFFLYGKGGPSTKYAKHCCGNLIGGSGITPMTKEDAQKWVQENLAAEDYNKIFPAIP